MKTEQKYVIRNIKTGWYVGHGSHETSMPDNAVHLGDDDDLSEWLKVWGSNYEGVPLEEAKEVFE